MRLAAVAAASSWVERVLFSIPLVYLAVGLARFFYVRFVANEQIADGLSLIVVAALVR